MGVKTIGAIILQPVGKVATGYKYCPEVRFGDCLGDAPAEPVQVKGRQTGNGYSDQLETLILLGDEIEGNQCAMVQELLGMSQGTCVDSCFFRLINDVLKKAGVVLERKLYAGCVEGPEITCQDGIGRDMDVVPINRSMGRGYYDYIGSEIPDLSGYGSKSVYSGGCGSFLPSSHFRNDDWRMRNHIGFDYLTHKNTPAFHGYATVLFTHHYYTS